MRSTMACMILACFILTGEARAATQLPAPGDTFPDLEILAPLDDEDRQYLGLKRPWLSFLTPKSFTLSDSVADVLVVEFFNIYCTSCQAQAPVLNRVFAAIDADAALRDRVTFIGIGAGNSEREIAQFAAQRGVSFPLVPDPDFVLYNAIGDPGGTPLTLVLRRVPDDGWRVFASHHGLHRDVDQIRNRIVQATRGESAARTALHSPPDDRMLRLAIDRDRQRDAVRTAVLYGQSADTQIERLVQLTVPGDQRVWQAAVRRMGNTQIVYAVIISRKPVCDLCHGIHFILVFDPAGTIVNFMPLHVTKWGNAMWDDSDSAFMRARLNGRSIRRPQAFDAQVDAVATATMSSALIINSVNSLDSLRKRLPRP